MTKLMQQVIAKLQSLPEDKQDQVAGFMLHELESERRWEQSSIDHAQALRTLADDAWAEHVRRT